jgi:hypothetical protein
MKILKAKQKDDKRCEVRGVIFYTPCPKEAVDKYLRRKK